MARGKGIPVGDIPKMDNPSEYFFNGNLGQNATFLIFHFWYGVEFFLHQPEPKGS
jgi:hypothetical protein